MFPDHGCRLRMDGGRMRQECMRRPGQIVQDTDTRSIRTAERAAAPYHRAALSDNRDMEHNQGFRSGELSQRGDIQGIGRPPGRMRAVGMLRFRDRCGHLSEHNDPYRSGFQRQAVGAVQRMHILRIVEDIRDRRAALLQEERGAVHTFRMRDRGGCPGSEDVAFRVRMHGIRRLQGVHRVQMSVLPTEEIHR